MTDKLRKTLPLRQAYPFAEKHGLAPEIAEIRHRVFPAGTAYTSSIRRSQIVELFRTQGIWEAFIEEHWPFGQTPGAQGRVAMYDRRRTLFEQRAQ